MKIPILLFLVAVITTAVCNQKIKFERLEQFSYINQGVYQEVYVVSNFWKTPKSELEIDRFACSRGKILADSFKHFDISFYRKSMYTNAEYLKKHPRHFTEINFLAWDEGSFITDFIWAYNFYEGAFTTKHKHSSKYTEDYEFKYPYPACLQEVFRKKEKN